MRLCHIVSALLFLVLPLAAAAQGPQPRLRGPLRDDARAVLPGSRPFLALQGEDLGPAQGSEPLRNLTLVFSRSAEQQRSLDTLLAAQQDPASPLFHQWLTPEGFGQRFGVAEADLALTRQWLESQGFVIGDTTRAHDRITFSGTAATVDRAFGAALHRFRRTDGLHLAPTVDLALPAGLASITTAILHLEDIRPVPLLDLKPAFTVGQTGAHYLSPQDLGVLYDLPPHYGTFRRAGSYPIAIVGQSFVDLSGSGAVTEFVRQDGTLTLTGVLVPGSGVQAISPGDSVESEIDIEYSAGLLRTGDIFLVYTGTAAGYNVFDALDYAIQQDIAPVVSISYAACEPVLSSSFLQQSNSIFQQAAAQGQSLIASAGDAGSTSCLPFPASSLPSLAAQQALAVNFPASSPYVTAVGGLQMAPTVFATTNSTYWSPAIYGLDAVPSLLSYAPEITWNEDSPSMGIFAGGGGSSMIYPRPSWQTGVPGIPSGPTRLLPDVALQASAGNPGFLFCTDVASYGGSVSCPLAGTNGPYNRGGGTSFAAPALAALISSLNLDTGSSGQGNLNPTLYQLASNPQTYSRVFHDITSGTIACPSGLALCSAAGQSGFAAGPGYDQATGLGSIDYQQLLAAWPVPAVSRTPTSIQLFPSSIAPAPGAFDSISIVVSSNTTAASTPPSGTAAVTLDGQLLANVALSPDSFNSSGSSSYLITAPAAIGTHIFAVTYPGDSTHTASRSIVALNIGTLSATGSFTVTASNVALPTNSSAASQVTVTPAGGYNGRLAWSLSLSGSSSTQFCYIIPSPVIQGSTQVSLNLSTGSACGSASGRATASPTRAAATCTTPHLAGSVLAALAGILLPLGWRRYPRALLLLLFACVLPALSGCGSGGASSGAGGGSTSPASVYTATLTAKDSVNTGIVASTTFTITVQ